MSLTRPKRLAIVLLLLAIVTPVMLRQSQWYHIAQVRRHIADIEPAWRSFVSTNQVYSGLHLYDYTGGDGMFGVYGYVSEETDLEPFRLFMESTAPPRPVFFGAVRTLSHIDIEHFASNGRTIHLPTQSPEPTADGGHE